MADYKELDDALSLVKSLCTTEQIQSLLRTRKGDENVRITADNKNDVVDQNLRTAVEARAIPIDKVFDLIRVGEENGNQHIFYYKPKSRAIAEALSYEDVGERLWGKNWEAKVKASFPTLRSRPNTFEFSDFRKLETKPADWILKIYGRSVITRFTGKTVPQPGNYFFREYVEEELRIILMARWNSPDLLEIRVQRNESPRRVDEWHNRVWDMLKPAIVRSQFDPWVLSKAMVNLIDQQRNNSSVYVARDATLIDTVGIHANFQTYEDQGNLFASTVTRESIERYLKAKSDCAGVTVIWAKQKTGIPQKDFRTYLAPRLRNELVALAHSSSKDLDYVTNQLRQFSK